MRIVVIGCGHVGLVSAAGFANDGHTVVGVDSDAERVSLLQGGGVPFHEPGLAELLDEHADAISYTTDVAAAVDGADVAFICVSTPKRADGTLSLVYVEQVARAVSDAATGPLIVVEKSTVPVRTARRIIDVLGDPSEIEVATNPEFLREGSAVHDTLNPDRIVIGVQSGGRGGDVLRKLYAPTIERTGCGVIVTDLETAEMVKHASNSYLAMKISYINAVAQMCEATGANIDLVTEGMALDPRIGSHHLHAGVGYGGSCFPKDVDAFIAHGRELGVDLSLLEAVRDINRSQREALMAKTRDAVWNLEGKTVAVWGLAFKPGTDDLREAPALDVIPALEEAGASVRAYDPAIPQAADTFPSTTFATSALDAVQGADALVVLTEWPEFSEADLTTVKDAMAQPVIIDGRNLWSVDVMCEHGFSYSSFGRPTVINGEIRSP